MTPAQREEMEETIRLLEHLSPDQIHVVKAIMSRFVSGFTGEHLRQDFMPPSVYEYFGTRLTAHHAYSANFLKKENFEHILEQAFNLAKIHTSRQNSMTHRGADLVVDGRSLSLKTEASQDLRPASITISKLMEAVWIKEISSTSDIPKFIARKVLPHFTNYDSIFMLRSYKDRTQVNAVRYDLHEIPKSLLDRVELLVPSDFSTLTPKRTTSADVKIDGVTAFKFRLDGSDDKLTINYLDTRLCPLHAWWGLHNVV